eukprot:XP_014039765.1 PREDICTED: cell migration-inducing and hyaluronan-binding protein-like [Salmo salar]
MKTCVPLLMAVLPIIQAVCPDREPGLQPWTPGHSEAHHVTIGYGRKVILTSSATVHSIEILNGGKLVIADSYRPILLRTKHILIGNRGQLHIGSPDCPYKGNLTISLFGRSDDTDTEHSYFGRKYIGVGTGGTLEIHGQKKLSWTFLNKTLHPGESEDNSYLFERGWGNRGIIVHVIDPKTGEVLHNDRYFICCHVFISPLGLHNSGTFFKSSQVLQKYWLEGCPAYYCLIPKIFQLGFLENLGTSGIS